MVLVLGLLALVVGYWVYQSKKAAQAAVRYQVHKDALEEARKVLNKYPHQKGADFDHEQGRELGEKYFFDLQSGNFPDTGGTGHAVITPLPQRWQAQAR